MGNHDDWQGQSCFSTPYTMTRQKAIKNILSTIRCYSLITLKRWLYFSFHISFPLARSSFYNLIILSKIIWLWYLWLLLWKPLKYLSIDCWIHCMSGRLHPEKSYTCWMEASCRDFLPDCYRSTTSAGTVLQSFFSFSPSTPSRRVCTTRTRAWHLQRHSWSSEH